MFPYVPIYVHICPYISIVYFLYTYMEVSWNGGAPKSSILVGNSIINHPLRYLHFRKTPWLVLQWPPSPRPGSWSPRHRARPRAPRVPPRGCPRPPAASWAPPHRRRRIPQNLGEGRGWGWQLGVSWIFGGNWLVWRKKIKNKKIFIWYRHDSIVVWC